MHFTFYIILAPESNETSNTCPDPNLDSETLSYDHLGSLFSNGTYSVGTVIHVSCHDDYQLFGKESMVCQEGGHWSSVPECIPNDHGKDSSETVLK